MAAHRISVSSVDAITWMIYTNMRITKLYKPGDLSAIISLMQNSYDSSLEPFQRMSRLVKALHDAGWKIERMEKEKPARFVDAVKEGKVPGLTASKDNPALAYTPMDIYARPGTKVRFTGYGGYDSQQANAREHLMVDAVYHVQSTEVGSWSSTVRLQEVAGHDFNTVMFAEVEDGSG